MDEEVHEKLKDILDNEDNSSIIKLTRSKIKEIKNNNLQKLQLDREKLKDYHKKLEEYRYVEDISDIRYGFYIRWINLKNPDTVKKIRSQIVKKFMDKATIIYKEDNSEDYFIICKKQT